MKHFYLLLLAFISIASAGAQTKTIVVLGSSTALGVGTSTYLSTPNNDSCWVTRLRAFFNKNTSDGIDTFVINLGKGGTNTYHAMPSNFLPPANRPSPDPTMNITLALTYNPDAIIINFPSNDITVGFTKQEIMDNFRLLKQTATNNGVKCFITTTQPRDDINSTQMQYQRDLVDSIQNNFGANSIDFWTDLVNPNAPPYTRRPEVAYPVDGIHVNDLGHRLIFLRASVKPYFTVNGPLPLKLLSFEAIAENHTNTLKWTTSEEEPNTSFEIQRSTNNREYSTLATVKANGNQETSNYSWTDLDPLGGKSFYRLKINEPSKTFYSKIVVVDGKEAQFNIGSVYLDGNNIHIRITNNQSQTFEASLVSISGAVIKKQKLAITNAGEIKMSIDGIIPGEYIVRVADGKGNVATHRFVKLK